MATTAEQRNDFPAWLPPAVVKELRQGLRTSVFTVTLTLVPLIMALLFLFGFIPDAEGVPIASGGFINGTFWTFVVAIMLIYTPARAVNSIKGEVDSRTIDLMVLTKLTPLKIVFGKWCSYMIQSLLIFSTLLPFFFMRYYYGNINLLDDFLIISLIVASSAILTALTIWTSGFSVLFRAILFVFFVFPVLFIGLQMMLTIILWGNIFGGPSYLSYLGDSPVVSVLFFFYDAIIIFMGFILLAARWIAPPSDNTSSPLRLLVLAALLPVPFCLLLPVPEFLGIQGIFALAFATFILILELTTPLQILPVHLAEAQNARFPRFASRCLVPGFYSASLFLLFYTIILLAMACAFFLGGGYAAFSSFLQIPHDVNLTALSIKTLMVILLWLFSVHAPAMALYPVQNKLKFGTVVLYYVIIAFVLPMIGGIASLVGQLMTLFIPWACLAFPFLVKEGDSDTLAMGVIVTAVVMAVGLIFIANSNTRWKLAKLRASKLSQPETND